MATGETRWWVGPILVLVLLFLSGCATERASTVTAGAQENRGPNPGCLPEGSAQAEGGRQIPRGAPPPPGLVPPNGSRVVGDVLKRSIWAPGTLRNTLPPVHPDQVLYSLTVSILSSAEQISGGRNLSWPGSTVEAFSCAPLASDLTGKKIEAILTLTGDTRGTRWWISNIRALP